MDVYSCPTCGSKEEKHDQVHEHGFYVSSKPGEPLALTVSVQAFYNDAGRVGRCLAFASAQMFKHFRNKQFAPFLPHMQIINTSEGNKSVILGHAYVTRYITYELPAA